MLRSVTHLLLVGALSLAAQSGAAHHSVSGNFDRDARLDITGTLTAFHLRNPHSRLEVDVVEDTPFTVQDHPHLGRSVGRFEGEALVIDTGDVGRGYVDTRGPAEGFPQSTGMRYEERYRADGDRLYVEIIHTDPVYYVEPFSMSFKFFRVDLEVLEFDCQMDAANYDERL